MGGTARQKQGHGAAERAQDAWCQHGRAAPAAEDEEGSCLEFSGLTTEARLSTEAQTLTPDGLLVVEVVEAREPGGEALDRSLELGETCRWTPGGARRHSPAGAERPVVRGGRRPRPGVAHEAGQYDAAAARLQLR